MLGADKNDGHTEIFSQFNFGGPGIYREMMGTSNDSTLTPINSMIHLIRNGGLIDSLDRC